MTHPRRFNRFGLDVTGMVDLYQDDDLVSYADYVVQVERIANLVEQVEALSSIVHRLEQDSQRRESR